jgi:hypothetical protein
MCRTIFLRRMIPGLRKRKLSLALVVGSIFSLMPTSATSAFPGATDSPRIPPDTPVFSVQHPKCED